MLVDAKAAGRPVGDTSSSAVYVTDLPKNFHGGDEALHFALCELFGQYGKIKKVELYTEKGMHDIDIFKGEALVVYHKTKATGSHDKGDPVYESCTDMDGRWRVLGKRNWRIHCEAAVWQKQGYDVTKKAKLHPCVELANLWEYSPAMSLSYFTQMQDAIRQHASEHIQAPFVKVDPPSGSATIWCKGAQDAIKFASLMQKSFFLGRKIIPTLTRKEKPRDENVTKLPAGSLTMFTGELTMKLPGELTMKLPGEQDAAAAAASVPGVLSGGAAPMESTPAEAAATVVVPDVVSAQVPTVAAELRAEEAPVVPSHSFLLGAGSKVALKGLVAKPENNGRRAVVLEFLEDAQKYQVRLDDGRCVKVKGLNLEAIADEGSKLAFEDPPEDEPAQEGEEEPDADAAEAEAAAALEKASNMAAGNVRHGPPPVSDPTVDGFTPTVCVDPSLLPKREAEEEREPSPPRNRSRSRERRQQERIAAAKARLEAEPARKRPAWVMQGPEEMAQAAASLGCGGAGKANAADGGAKEPEESREELLKMSVGKLKELLTKFGKTPRGCVEKRDFVDRLKPAK